MEVSLEELAKHNYNFVTQKFEAQVVEEFLVPYGYLAGEIDVPYLCREARISYKRVKKDIQTVFGTQKFLDQIEVKNEVSKKAFMAEYEFGLYPNVREWIGHIHRATGKQLTRNKLFQYLTEDNVDQRWETVPNDSFV